MIRNGHITGHVAGSTVWGEIANDDGKLIGTFRGGVTATGVQGTFVTRDDEAGTWSWDGPISE